MTREDISDYYSDDELLFLEEDYYDDCIVGVCEQYGLPLRVAYDGNKIISMLMKNMSEEEAHEYFSFNIVGAYVGDKTPVYIWMDL